MCLIVFAWHVVPGTALIAAGNRDEFYARPARAAHWWEDHPEVYAGRDLEGGGTWLGITKQRRFAALTNIRNPAEKRSNAPTRGALVANFLSGTQTPEAYVAQIAPDAARYNGFNLLVGDADTLVWFTNGSSTDPRNGKPLAPGVYGVSNGSLDDPWPKVIQAKADFASLICQGAPDDAYFEMLGDTTRASDARLPKTGVSLEWERVLSSVCIRTAEYGTRASTLVQLGAREGAMLQERVIR